MAIVKRYVTKTYTPASFAGSGGDGLDGESGTSNPIGHNELFFWGGYARISAVTLAYLEKMTEMLKFNTGVIMYVIANIYEPEPNCLKFYTDVDALFWLLDTRKRYSSLEGLYFETSYDGKNWEKWEYEMDGRTTKKAVTPSTPLYVRGINTGDTSSDNGYPLRLNFEYDGDTEPRVRVAGNFSSLFDYTNKTGQTTYEAAFPEFFHGCNITDVTELNLECTYPNYGFLLRACPITSIKIPSFEGTYDYYSPFYKMLDACYRLMDVYFTGTYNQDGLFANMFYTTIGQGGTLHCKPEMLSYFESQRDVMDLPSDWTIVADQ